MQWRALVRAFLGGVSNSLLPRSSLLARLMGKGGLDLEGLDGLGDMNLE